MASTTNTDEGEVTTALHATNLLLAIRGEVEVVVGSLSVGLLAWPGERLSPGFVAEPVADD